jgi:UDP-N-acetylmuramate dehydrogenase
MVNLGDATSADVIALVKHAQKMVKESSGYELEPEINFVGEF